MVWGKNKNGEKLLEFEAKNNLKIANTFFQKKKKKKKVRGNEHGSHHTKKKNKKRDWPYARQWSVRCQGCYHIVGI